MDVSVRDKGVYAFGPFRLDATRRVLTRAGEIIVPTPTVLDTLLCLVEHPGRIVTKEELLDAVWPGRFVDESNIRQTIFSLRKILGDDGGRMVQTAPGRGYRFTEPVRWESAEATSLDFEPAPSPPAIQVRNRWWPWAVAGAALVLLAGGLGVWRWRVARAPGPGHTVVLADFTNQTRDPIFDRSLGSVLRIDLGQSPFFNVLSDQQAQDTLALMTRPRDTPLTPALAGEVCARNNGDAVLEGAVAAFGTRYLVTLTATDCSGARVLAAEKAEVTGREAVVPALDRLIGQTRGKLGESMSSIETFNVPLVGERTASLEALKAHSEAAWLFDHGDLSGAIQAGRHAIDLDPNFAAAYTRLAAIFFSIGEQDFGIQYIKKAYSLRNTANEEEKFHIISTYDLYFTKDLNSAIREMRSWTEIYPRDFRAWTNLANTENSVGQGAQAIEDGKRAVAVNPSSDPPYGVLAEAYRHTGRLNEAWAIGARAIKLGLAGEVTHREMMRIALARHDQVAVDQEKAWANTAPAARMALAVEAEFALSRGRIRDAAAIFGQVAEISQREGLHDYSRPSRARLLASLGLAGPAHDLLSRPDDETDHDYIFAVAEVGVPARAETLLAEQLHAYPSDTLLTAIYAPQTRAVLALRRDKPAEAIAVLRPALPYEALDFDTPYLLGSALLAAGDGRRAGSAFQMILDHQAWHPESPLYALARLGLARADRLKGDVPAARRDYQAFLAAWKGADPDVPILKAAKAEYTALP